MLIPRIEAFRPQFGLIRGRTPSSIFRCSTQSSSNHEDEQQQQGVLPATATSSGRIKNAIVPGTIYFVSTPMGNLGDITLRALDVLQGVDLIASEDTRTTGLLLKALKLEKKPQVSHHQHNLQSRVPDLIQRAKGEKLSIAVVTDAGTPGISDPGSELAAACWEANVPLVPVPGACAAVAAMSISGFLSTEFTFYGFLPSKSGKVRKAKIDEIARPQEKSCIIYESPNRVLRTLTEVLEASGREGGEREERLVLCAREITKMHEELFRGTIREAVAHFGGGGEGGGSGEATIAAAERGVGGGQAGPRGEFTLIFGPMSRAIPEPEELEEMVKSLLREAVEEEGLSTSDAVKRVAKSVDGITKSEVYKIALEMREGGLSL